MGSGTLHCSSKGLSVPMIMQPLLHVSLGRMERQRSAAVRHWSGKPGVVRSNLGGGEMLREHEIVVIGEYNDEKEVAC